MFLILVSGASFLVFGALLKSVTGNTLFYLIAACCAWWPGR